MNFVAGLIGILGYAAFFGFMLWWTKAAPLIVIVFFVGGLLIYDWVQTLRYGEPGAGRR